MLLPGHPLRRGRLAPHRVASATLSSHRDVAERGLYHVRHCDRAEVAGIDAHQRDFRSNQLAGFPPHVLLELEARTTDIPAGSRHLDHPPSA